jgi:hypothetical protein
LLSRKQYFNKKVNNVTHHFKDHFICVLSGLFVSMCLFSTASHGQGEADGAPPPTPSTIQGCVAKFIGLG